MAKRHFYGYIFLTAILAFFAGFLFWSYSRGESSFDLSPIVFQRGNGEVFQYGAYPELSNADFFKKVKEKIMKEGKKFVEADLSEMKIRFYEGERMTFEAPIKTKGKEGSWWETPAGIYEVKEKEKSHFSSFGKVYTPWNIQFQGNFFIHGWPYYENGTPVSSEYSGGCVRLADEDAKKIYELAETGMPVLVFESHFESDSFRPTEREEIKATAEAYLAADLKSNFVYAGKNTAEIKPIASITKLMTALSAAEYINLEKEIEVLPEAIVFTSKPRLKAQEKYRVFDLLYPMLLESSNEAAEATSLSFGRNYFIKKMNEKATALGMEKTKFFDPTGASEENTATAEDLFNLAKYLYYNRSFVLDISSGEAKDTAYGTAIFKDLANFNDFSLEGFKGGKVGKTKAAKETALMIYKIEINGEKRPVGVIVLGSENNKEDVKEILRVIKEKYSLAE
ncbi:MAG: L,D-transpeptidase family protein [Candidatus Paceibacterota bacterium]